jgi:hypothetical protein
VGEPTVGRALRASLGAVWRERWLAPLGLGVALARGALAFPAVLFLAAVGSRTARSVLEGGAGPRPAAIWTVAALTSPRVLAIAMGLWLAGWLLWGALRAAWIAGAMPILAARLSGAPERPELAAGVAWRFGPVAAATVVGSLLDLLGHLLVAATALGATALYARAQGSPQPAAVALVVAAAATAAVFLAVALSALADTAVARAAAAGEGPATALAGALSSVLARPAAFVAAALGVALAGALAVASLESAASLATGFARPVPPVLLAVPGVLVAAVAAMLAAGVELWRLSALATLALGAPGARPHALLVSPPAAPPRTPRPAGARDP